LCHTKYDAVGSMVKEEDPPTKTAKVKN